MKSLNDRNVAILVAEVGTVCADDGLRACALVQDNGLTTAHTLAHELAHVLGVTHLNQNSSNNNNFVMLPRLESDSRRLRWSEQTRMTLEKVAAGGGFKCLTKR